MLGRILCTIIFLFLCCCWDIASSSSSWCEQFQSPEDSCESGWTLCRGYCYWLSSSMMNWTEAEQSCEDKGAHLVSIHSQEEQEFISDLSKELLWIGLTDKQDERTWLWSDGSAVVFTSWHSGQPDDYDVGQDCAKKIEPTEEHSWTMKTEGKRWDDTSCFVEYHYVCKKPTGPIHFARPPQLQLSCTVYGSPRPEIHWTKDGQNITEKVKSSLVGDLVTSTLEVSAGEEVFGKYSCVAENEHNQKSRSIVYNISGTVTELAPSEAGNSSFLFVEGFFTGVIAFSLCSTVIFYILLARKVLLLRRPNGRYYFFNNMEARDPPQSGNLERGETMTMDRTTGNDTR